MHSCRYIAIVITASNDLVILLLHIATAIRIASCLTSSRVATPCMSIMHIKADHMRLCHAGMQYLAT